MHKSIALSLIFLCLASPRLTATAQPKYDQLSLTQQQASHFASLALKCVQKEYPNKPDHVANDAADVRSPRVMHGAFYGCFD